MKYFKLLTVFIIFNTLVFAENKLPKDPVTGLVIDKGLADVKENCTVCHIGRFMIVKGGNREYWKYKIQTMQKAFGLWELKPEVRERILNYLAKHYFKKRDISLEDD